MGTVMGTVTGTVMGTVRARSGHGQGHVAPAGSAVLVHEHLDHEHEHPGLGHPAERRFTRRGLIGLGVAGGLVPSPSALVVLLGAIALGRTWFGVGLVVGYGLGMALTLMAAGLLLVKLRDRVDGLLSHRRGAVLTRVSAVLPLITAGLVVAVGLGLILNELHRIG